MTSLLKNLLQKRGIALEGNEEEKAPEGAGVATATELVDDSAIHGEPGTESNQAPNLGDGGTASPETTEDSGATPDNQGQEEGGAAGVSEEAGLGESEVTPDDLSATAVEADPEEEVSEEDVKESEEAVEEVTEVKASMEHLVTQIEEVAAKGGLTPREAVLAQTRANRLLGRAGLPELLFPSQESFDVYGERGANTMLVIGALKGATENVGARLTEFTEIHSKRVAALKA